MKNANPLTSFFNALLPTFTRDRVEDDSRAVRKELLDSTLPMLNLPAVMGSDYYVVEALDKELSRVGLRGNIWAELRELLHKRLSEWEKLNDILEDSFQKEIVTDGMDYYRLQILFVVSLYRFWGEYVRKLILVSAARTRGSMKGINKEYQDFVEDKQHREAFVSITEIMKMEFRDVKIAAEKGKDISVVNGPGSDNIAKRAQGIKSGFVPIALNPILYINRLFNQLVAFRYDLIKQQKEALEMEIMYMERQKAGATEDELAEIETVIQKMKSRIAVLEAKIEDIKED